MFLSIVPSKCAVQQQLISDLADLYNQKTLIDSVYEQVSALVTTIDSYQVLFQNWDSYIYYRTDPALTSLGGYYVYSMLAPQLGARIIPQNQFQIQYIDHNFRGRTYDRSPYKDVTPDIISIFNFLTSSREYIVSHSEPINRSYNTLYPLHAARLGNGLNVFLGGQSQIVQIFSSGNINERLLIFTDESLMSVMPFLAIDFRQITIIDLSDMSDGIIAELSPEKYSKVLFLYSIDTYIHSDILTKIDSCNR